MASVTVTQTAPAPPTRTPATPSPLARTVAALAALCAAAGGVAFIAAATATQGPWYAGYVSEAGVEGQPYRDVYRLGLYGLAVGLVLLAAALRSLAPLAAVAVLASGLLAGVSGTVSCSEGCPLPPFQTPKPSDVVHGGASVAGVGLCALAVLLIALGRTDSRLRRLSRAAVVPVVLVGLANAYAIGFVGRGYLTGAVERVMLLLTIAWVLAAAVDVTRWRAPRARPVPTHHEASRATG